MKGYKLLHTPFREQETKYWKDMDELHSVLHRIPGYFKGVVLELMEKPLSREDIREYIKNFPKLEKMMQKKRKHRGMSLDIEDNITRAIELKVLKEESGKLYLTPGGREIAEHMQEVIPFFCICMARDQV